MCRYSVISWVVYKGRPFPLWTLSMFSSVMSLYITVHTSSRLSRFPSTYLPNPNSHVLMVHLPNLLSACLPIQLHFHPDLCTSCLLWPLVVTMLQAIWYVYLFSLHIVWWENFEGKNFHVLVESNNPWMRCSKKFCYIIIYTKWRAEKPEWCNPQRAICTPLTWNYNKKMHFGRREFDINLILGDTTLALGPSLMLWRNVCRRSYRKVCFTPSNISSYLVFLTTNTHGATLLRET